MCSLTNRDIYLDCFSKFGYFTILFNYFFLYLKFKLNMLKFMEFKIKRWLEIYNYHSILIMNLKIRWNYLKFELIICPNPFFHFLNSFLFLKVSSTSCYFFGFYVNFLKIFQLSNYRIFKNFRLILNFY